MDEPSLVRPVYSPPSTTVPPKCTTHTVRCVDGVFTAYQADANGSPIPGSALYEAPSVSEYYRDLSELSKIVSNGDFSSFAYRRLQLFQARFQLHQMLNGEEEKVIQKTVPHRDFYNVRKVDTHVHHSSAMNQKHLLRFIKKKLKTEPNVIVIHRNGVDLTLQGVFDSLKLTAYDLSVDTLDVHADNNTFHRFDRFNLKYNPVGESRLREIFLKTDNLIGGRYLAELTHELFDDLTQAKYQFAEYRVSIYGRTRNDFRKLARWVCEHNLFHENVRWLIQIPRLWHAFKEAKTAGLESFQDMLNNIFEPLFAVTLDPSVDPMLSRFLEAVVGFDCVDDESQPEHRFMQRFSTPSDWVSDKNPPYTYYTFYLQQNLRSLNVLRAARGMSVIQFRPHAGEAGDREHLISAYHVRQLDQPRHRAAQLPAARVPVLPVADRHRHVAALEQRALLRLPQESVLQVLPARPQHLAVDRRPAAVSLHARAADRGVLDRGAGVEAEHGRPDGDCAQQCDSVGLWSRVQAALDRSVPEAAVGDWQRSRDDKHSEHACAVPLRTVGGRVALCRQVSADGAKRQGSGRTCVVAELRGSDTLWWQPRAITCDRVGDNEHGAIVGGASNMSIPLPMAQSARTSSTRADRPKTPRE
jgi:adenosine deaminase